MGPPKPPAKLNDGKYAVNKRLGAGCFGEVYKGTRVADDVECAIKVEQKSGKSAPQLEHEAEVLNLLRGDASPQGIAECYYYGVEGPYNCLVMEILGKSLEDNLQAMKGKLKTQTTVLIAEQVIQRIEFLHAKGLVHRDIKPENFMFGVGEKIHHVYIIDFGLSKLYWDKTREAHCQMKQKLSLTGTARYASINAHKGVEQSRRDDLEAIGHMFLYFLRGSLPWSGLDAKTQEEKYRKICEKKETTPLPDLCKGFPKRFEDYLSYARNLAFTERPDYKQLYTWLNECREPGVEDSGYEWFEDKSQKLPGNLVALIARQDQTQPDDRAEAAKKGCCTVQ
jgi:serine/threonine protein kinase